MIRESLFRALSAGVSVVLLLGGCTVGPRYARPAPLRGQPLPGDFAERDRLEHSPAWKAAEPAAHLPRGAWWTSLEDPTLDRLMARAQGGNEELAAATARYEQARALMAEARADWLPQVSATPNYVRQRTSENQPQNGRAAGVAHTYGDWLLPIQAGWEPDLFGRVRQQTAAARARAAASADDLESLRLSIQAQVASTYLAWQAAREEKDLLERTLATYQRSLELTQHRRAGGIASDLDVAQATTQWKTTETQFHAARLAERRLEHALATLCGLTSPQFQQEFAAAPHGTALRPATVPLQVPSELLEHRPDIAAAERRMAAANASVGLASLAFYPRLRLQGLAGLQSVDAGSFLDWPSRFWAVGPSLEWPIFTGGRLRSRRAGAEAAYREAVARYRQTVLSAFQEVEDGLAAVALLAEETASEKEALVSAQRTLAIAENRYRAGLVTYLEVAAAQNAALARERSWVHLQAEHRAAVIGLIKALGGGWTVSSPKEL